jgi:hypothetical protein
MPSARRVYLRGLVGFGAALLLSLGAVGAVQPVAAQQLVNCTSQTADTAVQSTGGWCVLPDQGLFYNAVTNWIYDPSTSLVYDPAAGVYVSLEEGWLYTPELGIFYDPQSGLMFNETGIIGGAGFDTSTGGAGSPATSNALLNQLLGAANTTVQQNAAWVAQLAQSPRAWQGNRSLLSPVGQGMYTANSAVSDAMGVLRGSTSPASVIRRYNAAGALSAGDAARRQVANQTTRWDNDRRYMNTMHALLQAAEQAIIDSNGALRR